MSGIKLPYSDQLKGLFHLSHAKNNAAERKEKSMGVYNRNTFGEQIAFSRADMATRVKDFDLLCDTDKQALARKDKLWKLPTAAKAVQESGDQGLCYWRKLIRDCVYPYPHIYLRYTKQEKDEVLKTYCESVSLLRDAVNGSQSIGSVQDPEHPDTQIDAKTWLKHGPLGDQRIRQIVFSGNIDSLLSYPSSSIRRSAARYKYGLTEAQKLEDALERGILIAEYQGLEDSKAHSLPGAYLRSDGSIAVRESCGVYYYYHRQAVVLNADPGNYLVVYSTNPGALFQVVSTLEEAKQVKAAFMQTALAQVARTKTNRRKKHFSVTTQNVVQDGGCPRSPFHKTGDDFLSDFHFRGGEFGNWLSENDILESMDASYVAFSNLASILGIRPESISFHGKMGIAFGSRGRGGAAAHYEPGSTDVINLTKLSGAGCLAHEWGHALDRHIADYLGFASGSLASEGGSYLQRKYLPTPMKDVLALMNSGTRYYRDSLRFNDLYTNTGNGYWYSKCEMFARAFDCYVLDKMQEAGITDTYLSGHAESFHGIYRDTDIYAYPIGDERKQFEQAFDHLIAWAKENEII